MRDDYAHPPYAHLSEEKLLLFADGELPTQQSAVVKAHLASCWDCRTRLRKIEDTIADFVQAHHNALDQQLPPIEGPRALLRARMAQSTNADGHRRLRTLQRVLTAPQLAYIAAACLIVALTSVTVYRYTPVHPVPHMTARIIPDRRLTPGAARAVSASDVCDVNYSDDAQLVPASVKQQVLREYGMSGRQSQNYELDYLISPQLGGTDDIRNLWPEPESSTTWNARAKDALEDHLYDLVCQGKINLETAQHDLATDWVSAYKRYFQTDKPVEPM
jgi:hypothetical protein